MIKFEEEIKKFRPLMEIEKLSQADQIDDMQDMGDKLREMYNELEAGLSGKNKPL